MTQRVPAVYEAIPVIHRDDHLVAIAKPPGLLVHRSEVAGNEEENLVDRLSEQLGQRVWTVHRLDRATSGIMVFALSAEAAGKLGRSFEDREVSKRYLAIVRGWPAEDGEIDHPVKDRDRPGRPGKAGLTRFRTLATIELPVEIETYPTSRLALIELEPLTGRRHQLRRHMKHISHPIIGDTSFGRGAWNRWFRSELGIDRLLLHAVSLRFPHPQYRESVSFTVPPADGFALALAYLGWSSFVSSSA